MKKLLHGLPRHSRGTRITDNPGIRGARGLRIILLPASCFLLTASSLASTNYVWQSSPTPTAPYSSWATAAHTIQNAVDAANSNNTVPFTNGFYNSGMKILFGSSSNRVAITKPLLLKSVNDICDTIISGSNNVRTLFITAGVEVEGFTITGGYVVTSFGDAEHDYGGNVLCWSGGVVRTSLIIGGGAWIAGGNVCCYYGGVVDDCEITYGYCMNSGGGAACQDGGAVKNSIIKNNIGNAGGGIHSEGGTIENNIIIENITYNDGGGINTSYSIIRNCLVAKNFAYRDGGGIYAYFSSLQNNTICSNKADKTGGGVASWDNTNANNIIYYNLPDNYTNNFPGDAAMFNCSYPKIPGDNNSVTNEPNFIDYQNGDYRLLHDSPCFNAGTNEAWMVGIPDLSYQNRIIDGTVDIGAYEIGKLICEFNAEPLSGIVPLNVNFNSIVSGTNIVNVYFFWDFDNDGKYDSTGLWQDITQFIYTNEGFYSVSLTVSNSASETAEKTVAGYIEVVPEPGAFGAVIGYLLLVIGIGRKFITMKISG